MKPEPCERCEEPETLCTCWRCVECETLHLDHDAAMESDTGEMVCLACWSPSDPLAVNDWVTFRVNGDGERLTGRVIGLNLPEVDSQDTCDWDEPVHSVVVPNNGVWAIHPSWIVAMNANADDCPTEYTITVRFTANRPLTADELDDLGNTVAVQVEEPHTDHQPAMFTTSNIAVNY